MTVSELKKILEEVAAEGNGDVDVTLSVFVDDGDFGDYEEHDVDEGYLSADGDSKTFVLVHSIRLR